MSVGDRASSHARHVTAEELWNMPEVPGKQLEIHEGILVEVPGATVGHHMIVLTILRLLDAFANEHELGFVFPDGPGYLLSRDPDILRIPDISYVSNERIPDELDEGAFWQGTPDLAIEVASPHDRAPELHDKVLQYLEAGTQEVWVIWPERRQVTEFSTSGIREYELDDELNGGDVLPGFSVPVAEIFAARELDDELEGQE